MENLMEIIKGRKSVRTYDGRKLSEEHQGKIEWTCWYRCQLKIAERNGYEICSQVLYKDGKY